MATLKLSLPNALRSWVEAQSETGRYSNSSDYICDLISRNQERMRKMTHMQKLVTEAENSGESELSAQEIFEQAKALSEDKDGNI